VKNQQLFRKAKRDTNPVAPEFERWHWYALAYGICMCVVGVAIYSLLSIPHSSLSPTTEIRFFILLPASKALETMQITATILFGLLVAAYFAKTMWYSLTSDRLQKLRKRLEEAFPY